ncbi:MAG TPA: type II secretion system protein [Verrucomicrobiae bacterium]
MIVSVPSSARRGFSLIELLVVISIIALLAAFTLVGVASIAKSRKISTARGELNQLAVALDNYKAKYGSYPPGTTYNVWPTVATNQLYYELSGAVYNSSANTFTNLDGSGTITTSDLNNAFGVSGLMNITKGSGEDAKAAKNFLPGLRPNQVGYFQAPNGNLISNLVTSVGGPDDKYYPTGNPFRYQYPGTNNPNGYDLWVELKIGGKYYLVCNWNNSAQVNSIYP